MAFLGIRAPNDVGRLIAGLEVPGERETPSEYHITILCFEDNWPISEISKATEATYEVISEVCPFLVKSSKVSHFPAHDGTTPIIAPIDSKELHEIHKKLCKSFDKAKIDYKKTFKEYKPHITLAYSKDKHDDFKIDPKLEFSVNEVVLWGGDHADDRIFITFPLKGPERAKKNAVLLQTVEVFEKIAANPLQDYLTPSYERRKTER
ncbi:MAG: 2'-5' RNA ligase family protein [Nitrosotalea sp.]